MKYVQTNKKLILYFLFIELKHYTCKTEESKSISLASFCKTKQCPIPGVKSITSSQLLLISKTPHIKDKKKKVNITSSSFTKSCNYIIAICTVVSKHVLYLCRKQVTHLSENKFHVHNNFNQNKAYHCGRETNCTFQLNPPNPYIEMDIMKTQQ